MQDELKVLSISVAAYNSEDYLRRCLDSLVNTSILDELDIIIVNDGSKDATLDIAREYENRFPESVRVIDKENGGHGSTINSSLAVAKGKYYKIVDSDDWVEEKGLEELVDVLRDNLADLVLNPYYIVDHDTGRKTLQSMSQNNGQQSGKIYKLDEVTDDLELVMHEITYRTEVLRNSHRSIDEKCFYVDQEYILYPLAYVKTIYYHSSIVYDYLLGSEEQSCSLKNKLKRMDQHIRVCNSVLDCYLENKYDKAQEKLMLDSISRLYHVQYDLFLEMNSKEGKKQFMSFESDLKKKSKKVYDHILKGVSIKRIIKMRLLRLTDYGLYGFFSWERKRKNINRI